MRLEEWMRVVEISQAELAAALGVSQTAVGIWVRRKDSSPNLPQALAIVRLTRGVVSLEDLLSEEGEARYHNARRGVDGLSKAMGERLASRLDAIKRAGVEVGP